MNKLLIFALLMVCQVICCFSLSLIPTFFPTYARNKGISEEIIGLIFISNPIGGLIASFIIGKILSEKNRFTLMVFGLFLQPLGLYLFAVTNYQNDSRWIILTAITARFINGIATSSFVTPLYAYIPVLFPESTDQKISISEFFSTIGFFIGPLAGCVLFNIGGYLLPFIFFGTFSLLLVPFIGIYFFKIEDEQQQQKVNYNNFVHEFTDSTGQQESNSQLLPEQALGYIEVFTNYPVVILTITGFTVKFMFSYFVPIIADFFRIQYSATSLEIGYFFAVQPFGYLINSIITASYTKHKILVLSIKNNIKQIFLGSLFMGIAAFFLGPNEYFTGTSHHLYVSLIALAIMGFTGAYLYVFTIPALNDYLRDKYPNRTMACANMASSLFNMGVCLGDIVSPPFAGFMVKLYGYDIAYSVLGIIILTYSFLFLPMLFFNDPKRNRSDDKKPELKLSMQQLDITQP